uniref:NADH dehydrogenase [ubiquinone] 1 beta subcomplex subunit 11, mitochondrial n=1 Tax=Astatotilapia calliptera TaxID=8154 RepID=A0AAX7V101_ASTCA
MLTRISRFGLTLPRLLYNPPARLVSQSKANSATGSTAVTELHPEVQHSGHGEVSPYVKNPEYHGFSSDPVEDEWNMKVGFFFGISVALVIGGTFIHYLPDHGSGTAWTCVLGHYLAVGCIALQNAVVAVLVQGASHSVQVTDPGSSKQPQTITLPPPCLTVDATHCGTILHLLHRKDPV